MKNYLLIFNLIFCFNVSEAIKNSPEQLKDKEAVKVMDFITETLKRVDSFCDKNPELTREKIILEFVKKQTGNSDKTRILFLNYLKKIKENFEISAYAAKFLVQKLWYLTLKFSVYSPASELFEEELKKEILELEKNVLRSDQYLDDE